MLTTRGGVTKNGNSGFQARTTRVTRKAEAVTEEAVAAVVQAVVAERAGGGGKPAPASCGGAKSKASRAHVDASTRGVVEKKKSTPKTKKDQASKLADRVKELEKCLREQKAENRALASENKKQRSELQGQTELVAHLRERRPRADEDEEAAVTTVQEEVAALQQELRVESAAAARVEAAARLRRDETAKDAAIALIQRLAPPPEPPEEAAPAPAPAPARPKGKGKGKKRPLAAAEAEAEPASPAGDAAADSTALVVYESKKWVHLESDAQPPKELPGGPALWDDKWDQVELFRQLEIKSLMDLQMAMAKVQCLTHKPPIAIGSAGYTSRRNQARLKAVGLLDMLWSPNNWWGLGKLEELLAFLRENTGPDVGPGKDYVNHDHRVAAWFWPTLMEDRAEFKKGGYNDYNTKHHPVHVYIAKKAREHMGGVRLVGLLREWHALGGDNCDVTQLAPRREPRGGWLNKPKAEGGASSSSAARPKAAPKPKAPRKPPAARGRGRKRGRDSEEEEEEEEGEDSDAEGYWSEHPEDDAPTHLQPRRGGGRGRAAGGERKAAAAPAEDQYADLSEYELDKLRRVQANWGFLVQIGLEKGDCAVKPPPKQAAAAEPASEAEAEAEAEATDEWQPEEEKEAEDPPELESPAAAPAPADAPDCEAAALFLEGSLGDAPPAPPPLPEAWLAASAGMYE